MSKETTGPDFLDFFIDARSEGGPTYDSKTAKKFRREFKKRFPNGIKILGRLEEFEDFVAVFEHKNFCKCPNCSTWFGK